VSAVLSKALSNGLKSTCELKIHNCSGCNDRK
jgi:hypothetical protein